MAQAPNLTPETCRAGRALLNLSQAQLAGQAGVSRLTVAHFERSIHKPIPANRAAIRAALEAGGVGLLPRGAVLLNEAAPSDPASHELPTILRALRAAAPRLRKLGVRHLSLFGSMARGAARPGSDLDLIVDLDARRPIDLFDYAGIVAEIQSLVSRPVDVARRDKLKPHVSPGALRDEIRVF
ncbi:MAG: nucleotidyltransferase domain-containing protein [Candidatus Binataceae bacterium]